jgi:hypothetical protein
MMVDNSNNSVTNFITRAEYESRQSGTDARVVSLENKIDALSNKIDKFGMDLSNSNVKLDVIKTSAMTIINIMVGAGIYVIGQFVITHHF